MGQQLGWYLQDTRALLNDRLGMFTPTPQLTRWINSGRRQVARVTGCLQILVPGTAPLGSVSNPGTGSPGGMIPGASSGSVAANGFYTLVNVESYKYAYANSFVQNYNAGIKGVLDVAQVAVSWSGAMRPALDYYSWDDFQAYLRSYQNLLTSYPSIWSTLGDGETGSVYLYPPPSIATEMEWLVYADPTDLYSDNDYDAIQSPFSEAVKYWAAALSFDTSQRWVQADGMRSQFYTHLGIDRGAVDRGKTSRYYYNSL